MSLNPDDYEIVIDENAYAGHCRRGQLVRGVDVNGNGFEGHLLEAPRSRGGTLMHPQWEFFLKPSGGGTAVSVRVSGRVAAFEVRNRRLHAGDGTDN